jgi:hypothetical protein
MRKLLLTFERSFPLTIGEACDANRGFRRKDFAEAAAQMVSEGLLTGRGDGFVVRYSLSKKGLNALSQTKGSDLAQGAGLGMRDELEREISDSQPDAPSSPQWSKSVTRPSGHPLRS